MYTTAAYQKNYAPSIKRRNVPLCNVKNTLCLKQWRTKRQTNDANNRNNNRDKSSLVCFVLFIYCFRPVVPPTSSKSRCKSQLTRRKYYNTSHPSQEKKIPSNASPQESNGPTFRKFELLVHMHSPCTDRKRDLICCQG